MRLDAERDSVRADVCVLREEEERNPFEFESHFGRFSRQALSSSEVERDALPPPVLNVCCQGHERRGLRIRRHFFLPSVAAILSPFSIPFPNWANSLEKLHLLV